MNRPIVSTRPWPCMMSTVRSRPVKAVSHHWGSEAKGSMCPKFSDPRTHGLHLGYSSFPSFLPFSLPSFLPSVFPQRSFLAPTDLHYGLRRHLVSGGWTWAVLPIAFSAGFHFASLKESTWSCLFLKSEKAPAQQSGTTRCWANSMTVQKLHSPMMSREVKLLRAIGKEGRIHHPSVVVWASRHTAGSHGGSREIIVHQGPSLLQGE